MTANPLSPAAILEGMTAALPTHRSDDTTSDMSSSFEAVALFTHACMVGLGFRLLGFNEDKPMEDECQAIAPRLPAEWNRNLNSHSFLYAHRQSSMRFVIKVDRLGGRAEIRGLGLGDERIHRLEITARDYVSSASLPLRITMTTDNNTPAGEAAAVEDRSDLPAKLERVFISRERMADLASLLKINIIQKLAPGLQKEGYQEEDPDDREARLEANPRRRQQAPPMRPALVPDPARPYPFDDPLAAPPRPRAPVADFPPPDFEDEYEINRPHRARVPVMPGGGDGGLGGRSPFGIGERDLYPPGLGPHDPLRQSFVPSFGGGPGGAAGGAPGFPSGGMHPTFDDPLFQGPGRGGGGGEGGTYDPQVPPGSRWDPVGPGFHRPPPGSGFRGPRGGQGPFGGGNSTDSRGFGGDII